MWGEKMEDSKREKIERNISYIVGLIAIFTAGWLFGECGFTCYLAEGYFLICAITLLGLSISSNDNNKNLEGKK